eukprot:1040560_1
MPSRQRYISSSDDDDESSTSDSSCSTSSSEYRSKHRKRKKKKKKKTAADDGDFMCKKRKNRKIGNLKDAAKIHMVKQRRKSGNDSDILLKLYREPRTKRHRERHGDRGNKPTNVDIV